jgi:hypothetical protein
MIPRDRLERLPIPWPGMEDYLVDSEGQVWRKGGAKGGKDRPLRGEAQSKAVRAWSGIFGRSERVPLERMPGAWQFVKHTLSTRTSERLVAWSKHDAAAESTLDYIRGELQGMARQSRWNAPEESAARRYGSDWLAPHWFVIRTEGAQHEPWLILGPLLFASIRSRKP